MSSWTEGPTISAVRELRPLIEANRQWAHENARMAPEVLEACRKAGVFTMVAPREVGGADASFAETMAVFCELGYSDPTIAWHAGNSYAISGRSVFLGEEERKLVFGGPAGPFGFSAISGGVANVVEGGYRLSGRWQFVTGCLEAPWASLNGVVQAGGEVRQVNGMPDARALIVPAANFEVEHTWENASAMRGTGSHAVRLKDAFVPEGLAPSLLARGEKRLESRASRWPLFAASPVTNGAIVVGIARRAVEEATRLIVNQSPRMAYGLYRDRTDIQCDIASAYSAIEACEANLRGMAEDVDREAGAGQPVSDRVKARMWGSLMWSLDQARSIASDMTRLSTSNTYATQNTTELGLRDIHAIAASMEPVREAHAAAGRVILGMPHGRPVW